MIAQLRQFGQARRGWIGVRIQQVTDDIAEGLGLPGTSGALIADVTPDGPAAHGGIAERRFRHSRSTASRSATPARCQRIVADTPINKTVGVDLFRKGKKMNAARDRAAPERKADAPPPRAASRRPAKGDDARACRSARSMPNGRTASSASQATCRACW